MKYRTYKQNSFIYAGITWITLSTPWTSNATEFISVLLTGSPLTETQYLFLSYFWIPIPLIFWLTIYLNLKYPAKQKLIIIIVILQGIIYEIIFIYYAITDVSIIGSKIELFNDELNLPFLLYVLIVLIIGTVAGISFGLESLKSTDQEIRLKGKFIIIAWISFFIAGIFDAGLLSLGTALIVIIRLVLMLSAVEFYLGFFLPNFIKQRLIKEET
ncbi:MAG: hypothetical protein ACTSYC_09295 [Promethearchaeota archaeon]